MIPPTQLLHLTYDGNFQHHCEAIVLSSHFIDPLQTNDEKVDKESLHKKVSDNNISSEKWIEIILDVTVFHPQGGGQPSDKGIIYNDTAKASIDRVVCLRETNVIQHIGIVHLLEGDEPSICSAESLFPIGSMVHVKIDSELRNILSECHTAGHVVDAAMARCDKVLPPKKAYHFLDGPYVEYGGNIPAEEREHLLPSLQSAFQVGATNQPTKLWYLCTS